MTIKSTKRGSKRETSRKRASKDFAPRKSQDVKGGSFISSIGKATGGVISAPFKAVAAVS
jgi:hypothetical protein